MPTLDNGVVIDERFTAKGYTPAAAVAATFGQGPRVIEGTTIHHWGVFGQTHDGVVNFFVNGPGNTSAHFVVSDGRVTCIVNPLDAAWHSGNAKGNAKTIGIELRPEATDGDYATAASLIRFLEKVYGPGAGVIWLHREWQATACPGQWNRDRLIALVNGGGSPKANPAPAPKPAPAPAPKPAPAPAPKPATKGEGVGYRTVVKGDTIWSIATKFGKSVDRIKALNPKLDVHRIQPGQRIYLLNHCFASQGDTLYSIARQFGFPPAKVVAANPSANIVAGQVIWLE